MIQFVRAAGVITALLAACAAPAAWAEPVETSLGVTVNAISGDHEVSGGEKDRTTLAPLPLGELTVRHGADSLRLEVLPSVRLSIFRGARVGLPEGGIKSIQLGILNATYRRSFAGGWFAGLGETVYNQASDFGQVRYFEFLGPQQFISTENGTLEQHSRVVGTRLELGRSVALGRDRLEAWAALDPRMHGIEYTRVNGYAGSLTCTPGGCTLEPVSATAADAETATQVDASARIVHRLGRHGELLYGVRYINYTARYGTSGVLADRNVGIAPVLGYRLRF